MKPLVLIVVLFLAFVSSPTGAHAQNLSAEIFTIKSLPQAQLGDRRAMVQGANIDALVEEIFKVIKPQQPALQALEISFHAPGRGCPQGRGGATQGRSQQGTCRAHRRGGA